MMDSLAENMTNAQIHEAGSFEPILGGVPGGSVRSIFFYNADIELGSEAGLLLFEPRYRLMVQRAMWEPDRRRQIIFLPNFQRYIGAHGDIGALAHITRYRPIRDGKAGLPRAEVTLRFTDRVLVLFHWEQPRTDSLHECTFTMIPPLPPPSSLLERLLDCLHQSTDMQYTVSTKRGFLNIHSEPTDVFDVTNIVGTLIDGEVITEIERYGSWVRHERGWSISRIRGDRFVWLVPMAPVAAELPAGVTMVPTSNNARVQHVLLHAPSCDAASAARAYLEELLPDSSSCIVEAILSPADETELISDAIERIAEAVRRYGVKHSDLVKPERASVGDEFAAQLQHVQSLTAKELRDASRLLGADHSACIEREELVALVRSALGVAAERLAGAVAAQQLLAGAPVPIACGAPCGMRIVACLFTQPGEPPLGACTAAREGTSSDGFTLPIPLRRTLPGLLRRSFNEQYSWEIANLPLCSSIESPTPQHVADAAVLLLRSEQDSCTSVQVPARLARTYIASTSAGISRMLRRVNWPRLRLIYLGQKQDSCLFSKLDEDLVRKIGEHIVAYTEAPRQVNA